MGTLNEKAIDPCLLATADRQITVLKSKILTAGPFILLVDDQTPHLHVDSNQYRGTPFQPYEVRHLQYLTMVNGGNRGLALPYGDWHDEIESCSPAAISIQLKGPPVPAKSVKIPSKKISIADYKKLKQDGNTKQVTDNGELRSRASSILSSEPMSRGPSSENAQDPKTSESTVKSGGAVMLRTQLADYKAEARRIASQNLNSSFVNCNTGPNRNTLTTVKSTLDIPSQKSTLRSPLPTTIKHPLPPRPQSPRRNTDLKLASNGFRQSKRPLDPISSAPTQVHKKLKNEISVLPSTLQNTASWKSGNLNESKVSSAQSLKLAAKPPTPSPQPIKDLPPKAKDLEPAQQTLLPIPPLLSPLPDYLDDSANLDVSPSSPVQKSKKKPSNSANTDQKSIQSDSKSNDPSDEKKSRSSSPIFIHPPLLSPDLPPIVEQELSRLQKKNNSLNSVEARHEKVRQPNTPGVARKTPKIGHPPKKPTDTIKKNISSKGKTSETMIRDFESEKSFLVKIKYKKRRAKDIERILRMTPKVASARFQELDPRKVNNPGKTETIENDAHAMKFKKLNLTTEPPTSKKVSSAPKKVPSKKRPSDVSGAVSPPTKRSKSLNTSLNKSRSSLESVKSPAPSSHQKNVISTPKKSDVNGSNIRKAPSTESVKANSPSVTTPVPAEKRSLTNTSATSVPSSRPDATKYVSEALLLKRKMDSELKTKDVSARQNLSDHETQAGLCTGIECLLAYYSAFSVKRENRPSDRANNWESTLGLLEFVVRTAEPFLLLQTLAAQLNALVKEELNRSYLEHVSIVKEAPSELLEKIVRNSQSRDRYWVLANRGKEVLKSIGFTETVGPWTSWRDGREYFLGVLGKYEDREKLGWKASFE